jgi:hypothetical protein
MSDRRRKSTPTLGERRAPAGDRRAAPRYATGGTSALIGWAEGEAHRTTPARLIDISMGGFSAWVEEFPPRGVAVWFRLEGENPSPWIKASVVKTIKSGYLFWTRRQARFRFLEACPYELFKDAIEGFSQHIQYSDQVFEGFNGRYWR